AALADARALDWGPLTLRAIGPDATAKLAAALDVGASTAGALGEALDGASAAPETALAAMGAAPVGDAAALGAVVEYLEALRARCREMPLRQRDARVGDTEHIYVPLYTTSPHDADRDDLPRGRRVLREREERPPPTVHDRVAAHRCVFVVGEPGSGKTTTLRRLCAELCEAHLAADSAPRADWMPDQPLPVWLDLRDLPAPASDSRRRPSDLLDFAFAHLDRCDGRDRLDSAVADRALEEGRLILVLDGLDEVPDPTHRRQWADAITALATTRARKARVWVSCREAARAAGAEPGAPFVRVDLQPFDHEQRRRVIAGWLRARVDAVPDVREEADALLADLRRHPDVARQAGSPLILAMIFACSTSAAAPCPTAGSSSTVS
ncbi:MAG: NACHT domain-containing protein, partial [bacterium]